MYYIRILCVSDNTTPRRQSHVQSLLKKTLEQCTRYNPWPTKQSKLALQK